jgi:Capsular polysaccharide synthesis protein
MAPTQFPIPKEFQDQLHNVEVAEKRSDDEILTSLTKHVPVTSEKNIWAYWHAGLHAMPPWCQRNIVGWVKLNPGWTIRVLDTVPESPNHALKFVPPEMLPETFVKGTMDGPYKGPHSADFLRGALLYLHGGAFMDVGIILFRQMDRICWSQLEDPQSPFQVSVPNMYGSVMANHFVASRKGDPFIMRWHNLFMFLWKDRTNYSGMIKSPLLSFALGLDFSESRKRGYNWEFIVEPFTVFEYITQVTAFLRLTKLEDAGDGFSCADYSVNNILWFDALEEDWGAETVVGYRGDDAVNALATKLDADPDSEEYQLAYKLVWRLLTKSSMQKITHGKHLTKTPAWGLIWDEKGNESKDIEPGTFAELLRYGSVHFEQTRESIVYVKTEKPAQTFKKGVFEP